MRVKAVFPSEDKYGFYSNKRRFDGDEFELSDPSHFSEKWMISLEPEKQAPRKSSKPKIEIEA